jgi:hypothetical protein
MITKPSLKKNVKPLVLYEGFLLPAFLRMRYNLFLNMRTLHKKLFTFVFTGLLFLLTAAPASAQGTQAWSGVCTETGNAYGVATIQGLQCLVGNLLQVAVSGIGLAGFVMLILGSFRYLLSGGNAKGIDEGKNTMTYAIVGLVVSISAYFILRLISDFTGVRSILNFVIPMPSGTIMN